MSAEEERHKGPYTAARIKAAYQLAQQQIGDAVGTADPAWILCGFADLTAPATLAVAAAPISAWTGGGDVPAAESRAVALLPQALAVQLLAWSQPTSPESTRRRMMVLAPARPDEPRLKDIMRAVLSVWDPDDFDLGDTWRAATATCI
jgi:hypothetical protein